MNSPRTRFSRRSRVQATRRSLATSTGLPLESLEVRRLLSTVFTVTTTADTGTGSLRAAINEVNADTTDTAASPDQIDFQHPDK